MFRKALVVSFVLAAHAVAQRINMLPAAMVARQTTAAAASSVQTINPSQISAELNSFLSANPVSAQYTSVSETLGISVPSSLQIAIMTAVPASVLIELMNPVAQASIESEFQAGNTPAWYTSMPADVRSWFEAFAAEKATGSPVYTVTSTPTTTATAGSSDDDDDGDETVAGASAAASSSSSGMAARPTGADWVVVANAVAFAGFVGAVIVV